MAEPIEDVWAQIPDPHCKGLCAQSCGPIGAGLAERERIWERHGVRIPDPFSEPIVSRCPALTAGDRCAVYADRPTSCRLFGAVPEMPCPHGCTPTFGGLTSAQGRDMLRRSLDAT